MRKEFDELAEEELKHPCRPRATADSAQEAPSARSSAAAAGGGPQSDALVSLMTQVAVAAGGSSCDQLFGAPGGQGYSQPHLHDAYAQGAHANT